MVTSLLILLSYRHVFFNAGFSVQQFGDTKKNRNDVKASLRRKLRAMSSDEKKRHQDSEQLEMKPAKKAKKWSNLNHAGQFLI